MAALLFALLFIAPAPALAQKRQKTDANIHGHVIDGNTGEHLSFALIFIKDLNISAETDSTGHYYLSNLAEGRHTIEVSLFGHKKYEGLIDAEIGETKEYNFTLFKDVMTIDQVVVTANRYATKRRESGQIVCVVSPKLFENVTAVNPAGVLNFQPGLRVEYNCGNCGFSQLRINGLSGQYSQVLLDSKPIFSSLSMVYGLEQLPESMIERIEVVRGGGSALFGSNAIGGTVNIITKEPIGNMLQLSNQSGIIGARATDINTSLNASVITEDRRAGAYLFTMIRDRDAYDRNNDGFSDMPRLRSQTIGMRMYHNIGEHGKLTAEYHHIHEFRRGGDTIDEVPHLCHIAEQAEHRIDGCSLSWDGKWGNNNVGAFVSAQGIDRNSYYGAGKDPDAYGRTKDLTANAGAQYIHNFGRLWLMPATLTTGLDFTYNNLSDVFLGYGRSLRQTTRQGGLYVQNEWRNEKIGILLGVRADKHNMIAKPIVSPRLTLRYTPSANWAFRAGYASGFRAPQTYDEDLHVGAVGGEVSLISISPNLRPERSHAFSLSADWWAKLGQWQLNALVEAFYTGLKDVFVLTEKGADAHGNRLLERTNAPGAMVAGANIELRAVLPEVIELQAGITPQRSLFNEAFQWSETVSPQKRMFRAPDLYGYFTADGKITHHLKASLNCVYTGPMLVQHYAGYIPADAEVLTPDFFDLSARLAWHFHLSGLTRIELSCAVKNILDSYQKDLDVGKSKDSAYICGPSMPRSFYFGAKLVF